MTARILLGAAALAVVVGAPQPARGSSLPTPESALHFLPPLGPNVSLPALDKSLLDQLTVEPCRLVEAGCTPLRVLSANSVGGEKLTVQSHYTTTWDTSKDPIVNGSAYRIVVRVGGLRLGSVDLVAVSQQVSPNNGVNFNAGDSVNVKFHVRANPVIRARAMHARFYPATVVADQVIAEFGLTASEVTQVLYGDLRDGVTGRYSLVAYTPRQLSTPSTCASSPVADTPYPPEAIVQAITCAYAYDASAVARLLDHSTGLGDASILHALRQTFATFDAHAAAGVLKDALGESDVATATRTLLDAGYPVLDTATVLRDVYGQANSGTVDALRANGYDATAVANVLKEPPFQLVALDVTKALLGGGFAPHHVAQALVESAYGVSLADVVRHLTAAGLDLPAVAAALRDGAPDRSLAHVLAALRAGTPADVTKQHVVNAVVTTYANVTATALQAAIQAVDGLNVAGFEDQLRLLKQAVGAAGLNVFSCLDALRAVNTSTLDPFDALTALHRAGCRAEEAIPAVATVLAKGAQANTEAALQLFDYSKAAITEGLHLAHPALDVVAALAAAARNVVSDCSAYKPVTTLANARALALLLQRGGLGLHETVLLLHDACALTATDVARVVGPTAAVLNTADELLVGPLVAAGYEPWDVVAALRTVYADSSARIAGLLADHYTDQLVVTGLARALPLSASDTLTLARNYLGVSHIVDVTRLLANAKSAADTRIFAATDVLRSLHGSYGKLAPQFALVTMHDAGYDPKAVIGAVVAGDADLNTSIGAQTVAAGALQIFSMPMDGVTGVLAGLQSAYGTLDVTGLVRTSVTNYVGANCAALTPTSNFGVAQTAAGLMSRSDMPGDGAAGLLKENCGFSARQIGYVTSPRTGFFTLPSTPVRAATTAALTDVEYAGTGPGTTITASASGALPASAFDEVVLRKGDRVLVKNETTTSRNGVYVVTSLGGAFSRWQLQRAKDLDEAPEFSVLKHVVVGEGVGNAGKIWALTAPLSGAVDTAPLAYGPYTPSGSSVDRYGALDGAGLVRELVGRDLPVGSLDGITAALRYAYGLDITAAAVALGDSVGMTKVLTGLRDVYLANLDPVGQAVGLGAAMRAIPDLLGVNPLKLLDSLAGTMKTVEGVDTPLDLQCVTAVGAITGGEYALVDPTNPTHGVLANIDNSALAEHFPDPLKIGPDGSLAGFGACLADGGVEVPFPLREVTVKFQQIRFGGTTPAVPQGLFAVHLGWSPGTSTTPLDDLGIGMLPAAAWHGNLQSRNEGSCLSSWARTNIADEPLDCQLYDVSGLPKAKLNLGVGNTNGNSYHMLVPALPGKITMDAGYYSATALSCATSETAAIRQTAIALPVSTYLALPGAIFDVLMRNHGESETLSDTPVTNSARTLRMEHEGTGARCGRTTADYTTLSYQLSVKGAKCVVSSAAVTELTGCVTPALAAASSAVAGLSQSVPTVTDTINNGYDVSKQAFPGAPGSGATGLGAINSQTGNFLALLDQSGVAPGSGLMLARMLTTGYPM